MIINFTVPGRPVPMARPRVVHNHAYTPKRCSDYQDEVSAAAILAMHGRKMLTGAVVCRCVFYFEPPKSTPKKRIADMLGAGYTMKIDTDNLLKSVTDAISGIVYEDDKQIVIIHGEKRYGYPARAEVVISEENE